MSAGNFKPVFADEHASCKTHQISSQRLMLQIRFQTHTYFYVLNVFYSVTVVLHIELRTTGES